jgi:capsule polysaccharide export protein KpsE/RkpR
MGHQEANMPRKQWKRLVMAALIGALGAAAPAVAKSKQAADPEKLVEKMEKKLALNQVQRDKVDSILADHAKRLQSLYDEIEALKEDKHRKIKAVLSPEQQQKYDSAFGEDALSWKVKKGHP